MNCKWKTISYNYKLYDITFSNDPYSYWSYITVISTQHLVCSIWFEYKKQADYMYEQLLLC